MKLPRYVRLLPSVVVVGTALLVMKTSGLVHEAYAEAASQKSAPLRRATKTGCRQGSRPASATT